MIITVEQLNAGIVQYIDRVIIPKAPPLTKFLTYFFVPSIPNYINNKVKDFLAMDTEKEFFSDDGNIKLEKVYNRAKQAMEHSGKILIPKINYFVDTDDIDTLYSIIKETQK